VGRRDLLSGGPRGRRMRKQWDWQLADGEEEKAVAVGVAAGFKFRVPNFEKHTGRVGLGDRVGFTTHESNPISSGLTHLGQPNLGTDPFGSAQEALFSLFKKK
jgi:hypothetical protein